MKADDPRLVALRREARRRFGRGQALLVAAGAAEELRRRCGVPTWEAWVEAGRLMDAHGRAPTMDEMKAAMAAVQVGRRSMDPEEKRRSAGALHCVLRALGRWSEHTGMLWMAPMAVRDFIGDLSTDPREEEALARALADAAGRLAADGSYGEFAAADARTMHAVGLLRLPEADAREAGRGLLAEQVAAMERLLAGELVFAGNLAADGLVASARMVHAMAVNNLAQAWEQRVEGERADNLRRAITLYEQCCALPARVAEPEKLLHSLHHLALCLRGLADEVDDVAERGSLLVQARDIADRGLALARQHSEVSFPMLDALRLNRANTETHWLLWQKETGALAPDETERRLRGHVEEALAWLRASRLRGGVEGSAAETFFAQLLGQEGHAQTEDAAVAALQGLVRRLAGGGPSELRFMNRDEARLALSAMVALTPDGEPSPTALRPDVHGCLPVVLGALHPLHVGVATARGLYGVELAWIAPRLRALGSLGRKYIEDAISGMHRWMCDADLPDAHRRLFAAQVGQLASLALDLEVGLVGLDDLDRVRFHDLTGAAFYRSESTFYGQGPSHWSPLATEAGWRLNLYRARQDLDHCALLHTYEELRPLIDQVQPGALDEALATMRLYRAYSETGSEVREIRSPLAKISELRAEILEIRRYGQSHGWRPAFVETTPAPQRDEIAAWLREHPTMGVLIAGDAELGLVHGDGAYLRFADWCGEDWSRMLALADELARVWAKLLQDPSDAARALGELDAALLQVTLNRGWRALAEKLAETLIGRGLTCVTVVERGVWRAFPWGSLPVGAGVLADVAAFLHVPTLATTGARAAPLRGGAFAYVGAAEGVAPELEFGRAVFRSGGDVIAALRREAFEQACIGAGVVRVFTHGEFNSVDATVSGILLDVADEEPPYQGYEIATMDLGGCGRVELWACESGVQMDFLGELLGNDEPLGIASCFLLAGARVVIGSLWKQPAMVAGLIAAAFSAVAGPPGSAEHDARALAQALANYRRAVDEGGPLEEAFCRSLAASLRSPDPVAGVVNRAVHAAWCEAATCLAGRPIEVPLSAIPEHQDAGLGALRELVDEPEELDQELRRGARRIFGFLRGPAAWAGWRVLARDRTVV